MSKEKIPYNSVSGDYSNKKFADINSSEQKASYIENLKQIYLPDSKFNYVPSEDNIEHANNLNSCNRNQVTEAMVTKNNATSFNNNEKDANLDQSYLPKMRTDYSPSNESVESATGVDFPINIPNPATDSITVNNIATQEFDYTQDLTLSEGPDSE